MRQSAENNTQIYSKLMEREHGPRTLSALRATLLPKLISGELQVKDAERFIGECA